MEAGECVIVADSGQQAVVAIPEVRTFGSPLEPGALVRWRTYRAPTPTQPDDLSEARLMLAQALQVAIETLETMDVARWRPEEAEEIALLASSAIPQQIDDALPPGLDPRRIQLLVRAARLEAIADLAMTDDGATVTLWAADQRLAALRHVAGAARLAMSAASYFPHTGTS